MFWYYYYHSGFDATAQSLGYMLLKSVNISCAAAFFNKFEHLGNCGLGVWHWAAFYEHQVLGVVSFGTTCFGGSRGFLSEIAMIFRLPLFQICRGGTVYNAPRNAPSRILSGAMRELRRTRGNCLVVAYSDPLFNEVGTIYQACNAVYTGRTRPKNQANYVINGRPMSGWTVRKRFGTRDLERLRRIDPQVRKLPLTSKFRYVFVEAPPGTKARVVKALQPFSLPYPSRESERIGSMDIAALIHDRKLAERGNSAELWSTEETAVSVTHGISDALRL